MARQPIWRDNEFERQKVHRHAGWLHHDYDMIVTYKV
jgi:hypothetical protein